MSIRTEYKPGDRVKVGYSAYSGSGTVVSWPMTKQGFDNPSYQVVQDTPIQTIKLLSHSVFSPLFTDAPPAPKPRYTLDELRLIVDRETELKAERNPYNLLLDTSVVEELSDALKEAKKRLASAPDSIADAFIDKVADRVAAKVKAKLHTTEPAPQDGAQRVALGGKWYDHNGEPLKQLDAERMKHTYESLPDRYVTATDKQSIKAALAAGKIVNAPHKSGKTTAILELLRENPGKYVAVYSDLDAELGARQRNYHLFGAYPDEHDTDNIHRSGQEKGSRLVITDGFTDLGDAKIFASVYTR